MAKTSMYERICWRGPGGTRTSFAKFSGHLSRGLISFALLDTHARPTGVVLAIPRTDVAVCFASKDSKTGKLQINRSDCNPCGAF